MDRRIKAHRSKLEEVVVAVPDDVGDLNGGGMNKELELMGESAR